MVEGVQEPAPERWLIVNDQLVIVWPDGAESYLALSALRRACPCASCAGEADLLGRVHGGGQVAVGPQAHQLTSLETIGGYALQPTWGDGHSTGIYTYSRLKSLAAEISEAGPN